jgi:hypothetical protein
VNATSAIRIPVGTTAQRPSDGANGDIRYNTTNANFEWHTGTAWREPVNAARSPAAGLANRFSKFNADGLLDTSAVLVQANGKIGIGNVAPDSSLTVLGGGRFTGGLNVGGITRTSSIVGSTAAGGSLTLTASNSSTAPNFFDNAFVYRGGTNGTRTLMQVIHGDATSGSVVGIPTVYSGSYALNVTGSLITDNFVARNANYAQPQANFWNTANNAIAGYFNLQKSRDLTGTSSGMVRNGDYIGTIGFSGNNGDLSQSNQAAISAIVSAEPTLNGLVPVDFAFYTSSSFSSGGPVQSERMRITYNGKIGINTNAPQNGMDVRTSFGRGAPVTVTASTHTVDGLTNWVICNRTSTITLTLPTASSWTGREIMIKTIEAQTVVSASSNVVPLAGGAATTAILPATDGAWCTLVSDGTNWIIMQRGS